ncbi:MD-2-related lipid-recognition domain-containing protein, partial [Dimargaris cristalligena]
CGNDQDLVTIESVRLNPDPPHKGQKLFIEGSGHVNQRVVNGSYIDVSVKYGLIKLLTRRFDLCDLVGEIGLKCPIEEGDIRFSKEVDIPKEIPPGIYTVNAIARLPDTK